MRIKKTKRTIRTSEVDRYLAKLSDQELEALSKLREEEGWRIMWELSSVIADEEAKMVLVASDMSDKRAIQEFRRTRGQYLGRERTLDYPNRAALMLKNRLKLKKDEEEKKR